MSQQTEQDLYARIAKLAEAEWDCPDRRWHDGTINIEHYPCAGTGRIVPFRALRVKCDGCDGGALEACSHCGLGELDTTCDCPCPTCSRTQRWECCEGRRWMPVPDLERACWRILQVLRRNPRYIYIKPQGELTKEDVIRAGELWQEEQER